MSHTGQTGIYFDSNGYRLLGRLFLAPGDDPKPTAVLLHGLPGIEQNHDLAFALREHGWNAVIFHYRGCWGSAGVYNFGSLPDDVRACLDYLSSGENPQVDAGRLVVVGHSMGGWAAVIEAAADERARAVAVIGPVVESGALTFDQHPEEYVPWLPGLSEAEFGGQWRALASDPRWNAVTCAPQIAPRPLLIVHAAPDDVVPVAQARLLYDAARDPRRMILHDEANHSFTGHRPWLRQQIITWLDGLRL
jgi:hypothetical protein